MEAIFCVTYLLRIFYAPRFKDLKKYNLYQFRSSRDEEAEWAIVPAEYVKEKVVRASRDDLLRPCGDHQAERSNGFEDLRRLNSYSR